jgi:hypothetical protein
MGWNMREWHNGGIALARVVQATICFGSVLSVFKAQAWFGRVEALHGHSMAAAASGLGVNLSRRVLL